MNDLIKHFAQEAGFKVDWQHEDVQAIKMARYEKFAQLIVAECISMADDFECGGLVEQMKQHFGVK